jgi:DNA-binding transcriptional ArsR family regulator
MHPPQVGAVPDDIAAEVEAQLAAQRAELTAKLVAERAAAEEKARLDALETELASRAAASAARESYIPVASAAGVDMAQLRLLLASAGVQLVPRTVTEDSVDSFDVPENDYSDTDRVQIELNALLDLLEVVRVRDVQEHVKRNDGGVMSPSNVRYHMRKLANRGVVKKVEERYHVPGLGVRTRDCWSKDTGALMAVLEGKHGKQKSLKQ